MPYILALIIIDIVVFFTNYTPHTWLVGWDNVMPELNIGLNLQRAIYALWQDYRGLGLVDGMAHSANLLHTIYIAVLSTILPSSMLRYVFITLTHLGGGIGMYLLASKLVKRKDAAFLAALFYMFNLGVIQMYFAPLEVFAVHFTALPLIILALFNALEKPNYKTMGIFFFTSFLLTPQSFVPTIFIAFSILFSFVNFFDLLFKKKIKTVLLTCILFFIANAFWLIPYIYSVKYSAPEIPKTKINQYSSEEIFYRNKQYGTLDKVLMLKGFMLSTPEIDLKTNTYVPFLKTWDQHSSRPLFIFVYISFIAIVILGLWKAIKEKDRTFLPVVAAWSVGIFFLANNTPVLDTLNIWIRNVFPLIGEAFRFPFTKFITLVAFCFSLILANGLAFILLHIPQKKLFSQLVLISGCLGILYLAYPVLNGQFYSPLLRLSIPRDYFETIEYFKTVAPDKRIAVLPAETFWNWEYRSWGHRGSGFLWYGIEQPMLIRPFDPWSTRNEQFYNELNYAMQKQDRNLFDRVLKKYSVEYLILDKSVVNAGKPKAIDYDKIEYFLSNSLIASQVQSHNLIDIYYIYIEPQSHDISILQNPPHIHNASNFHYEDAAYGAYGGYINDSVNPEVIYPYTGLFTEKTQDDLEIQTEIQEDTISIRPLNPLLSEASVDKKYYLEIPSTKVDELIPVSVELEQNQIIFTSTNPRIIVNRTSYEPQNYALVIPLETATSPQYIEITDTGQKAQYKDIILLRKDIPNTIKVVGKDTSEIVTVNAAELVSEAIQEPVTLSKNTKIEVILPKAAAAGSIEKPILKRDFSVVDKKYLPLDDTVLYVTSDKTNTEVTMWNPTMLHNIGYLLSVESSWNFGLPLTFYIDNPYVKRAEIDTLLSKEIHATNTIILPPIDPYHQGYGLHFIARTMGGITSETALHDVSAYPIPFNFLKELKLSYRPSLAGQTPHMAPDAERITPALYKVTIDSKTSGYIYFDQMYQDGWKAMYGCRLYILNCKFLEHVKVNNWANGWKLPPNISQPTTIAIFFWPQYLEFVGLLLFVLTTFFFIYKNDTRVNREKTVRTVRNFFRVLKSFYSKVLYIVKEEV